MLLDIKHATNDNRIRTCLSSLHSPGDAAAQEKYYHRNCLREIERECSLVGSNTHGFLIKRRMCDLQLLMSVMFSLSSSGAIVSMTDVNNEYLSILRENQMHYTQSGNHNKYLKKFLTEHVTNIEFIKSPRKNESENIILKTTVSTAVERYHTFDQNAILDRVMNVADIMREELLSHRQDWKFTGNLDDFQSPPITQFFITQLLFGSHSKHVINKLDDDVLKTTDMVCQFLVQHTKIDRQVKHQPKSDTTFVKTMDTPLSLGLAMSIHHEVTFSNVTSRGRHDIKSL